MADSMTTQHTVTQRKKWNPAKHQQAAVCRACGCKHFFPIATRAVANVLRRQLACRHCGRQITATLPMPSSPRAATRKRYA